MLKIGFGLVRDAVTEEVQGCQPNKMVNHILKLIKSILTVVMVTKLFVVMMIHIPNLSKSLEVKKQYVNL